MASEVATYSSKAVTRLYREMLRAVKLMPAAERDSALTEVRQGFRKNMREQSQEEIDRLVKIAESKLGYIKIVTPRQPKGGKSSFIFSRDGTVTEGHQGASARTLRAGIFPDDIARHKHLLERQHFLHRK